MKNARRSEAGVIQKAGGLFTTCSSPTSGKTQLLVGPRFERQIKRIKGMEPDEQRAQVKADLAEPSVQQDAQIRAANRATAAVGKPLRDVQLTWRRASAEDRRRIKAWVNEQIIDDEAKVALIDNHDTVDACAATGGRATEFVSP
jgi:hypothetical protein